MIKTTTNQLKELVNKKTVITLIVFFFLSILILQTGVQENFEQSESCKVFNDLENKRSQKIDSSIARGLQGEFRFRFKVKPSPLFSLFHHSSPFFPFYCLIDNFGVVLKINTPIDYTEIKYSNLSVLQVDFSRFVFIFLSLIVSFLGVLTFKNLGLLRSLNNFKTYKDIFFGKFFSRLLFIIGVVLILFSIVLIQFYFFNGITLSQTEILILLIYFGVLILFMILFFLTGCIVGFLFSVKSSGVALVIVWLILILVLSGFIGDFFPNNNPNQANIYKHDFDKFSIFNEFENSYIEKFKNCKTKKEINETISEMNKRLLSKMLTQIKQIEHLVINKTESIIEDISFFGIVFPTAFYSSISCELSSMGHLTLLDFLIKINDIQKDIVNRFVHKKKIENKDYIFYSIPQLPLYFPLGLILLFIYNVIFLVIVFILFKKSMFPLVKKSFKKVSIPFINNSYIFIKTAWRDFSNALFRSLYSEVSFDGTITIQNESIFEKKAFWLSDIGDVNLKDLAALTGGKKIDKSFSALTFNELILLFPRIQECDILILDNVSLENIEPTIDINILEINSQLVFRKKYDSLYAIYPDQDGNFEVKLEQKN